MYKMLLISTLVLFASMSFAQEGTWEFEDAVVVGWARATDAGEDGVNLPGLKNPYSVTLDPDGNVWCGGYYQRYWYDDDGVTKIWPDDIEKTITGSQGQDSVIVVGTYPIFIMNTEGVYDSLLYLTLPDQSIDTLLSGNRGMGVLPDGNIIASSSKGAVYKINYKNIAIGLTIFFIGLFKKVIIADNFALYSSPVFNAAEQHEVINFFVA